MMSLVCQKSLFSLPNDIHYLNNAAGGPMNINAEQKAMEALMIGRNPTMRNRDDFFSPVLKAKTLFGKLINTSADRIAIVPSASYGLATAANNIKLQQDDDVIVLEDQFPSNYYIWKHKCDLADANLKVIAAPDSAQKSSDWTSAILTAINSKTKIVAMANVHWMDGTYFDLEAIGKKCREHGSYLIIDGTQSVGALPFDIEKVQPDALIVASYKWLFGIYGLGFSYFGDRLLDGQPLEMNWINKERSQDFENLTDYIDDFRPGAARYSMGEQSSFVSIAMVNESLELINKWGPDNIQTYAHSLTKDAWRTLRSEEISIDIHKPSHHMTGLRFNDQWDMNHLQKVLKEKNIVVSRRGSALRVSVNVYNEPRDIEALVETILANRK